MAVFPVCEKGRGRGQQWAGKSDEQGGTYQFNIGFTRMNDTGIHLL